MSPEALQANPFGHRLRELGAYMQLTEFEILLYPKSGVGTSQRVKVSAMNSFEAKRLAEAQYGRDYHIRAVTGWK